MEWMEWVEYYPPLTKKKCKIVSSFGQNCIKSFSNSIWKEIYKNEYSYHWKKNVAIMHNTTQYTLLLLKDIQTTLKSFALQTLEYYNRRWTQNTCALVSVIVNYKQATLQGLSPSTEVTNYMTTVLVQQLIKLHQSAVAKGIPPDLMLTVVKILRARAPLLRAPISSLPICPCLPL
jgi:hypothetical protein